jgi:hypothetical protein
MNFRHRGFLSLEAADDIHPKCFYLLPLHFGGSGHQLWTAAARHSSIMVDLVVLTPLT